MKSCCHETCNVCHIYKKDCANFVSDLPKFLEIDRSCICGGTCDDHLRLALLCDRHNIIIVDHTVIIHAVRYNIEIGSGKIDRTSVCQMSAVV